MNDPNIFGDILLVEDNSGDVRLIQEMLKESDLNPTLHVVSDGSEALEFLHQQGQYTDSIRPDVILLDLHLPQMDGEEVLAEMDEEIRELPIVVISGSQERATLKLDHFKDDVDACLEKPIGPDEFNELAHSL